MGVIVFESSKGENPYKLDTVHSISSIYIKGSTIYYKVSKDAEMHVCIPNEECYLYLTGEEVCIGVLNSKGSVFVEGDIGKVSSVTDVCINGEVGKIDAGNACRDGGSAKVEKGKNGFLGYIQERSSVDNVVTLELYGDFKMISCGDDSKTGGILLKNVSVNSMSCCSAYIKGTVGSIMAGNTVYK